jgi:prephenate dehydratase
LARVAFQGEAGAFSEEALRAYFGEQEGVVVLPRRAFRGVAEAVVSGEAEYGILPVENTISGRVTDACDVLSTSSLAVVGEIVRPIRHCLLGVNAAGFEEIRQVISHPAALAQCKRFLSALRAVDVVGVYDTAGAAREVATRREPALAAVASRVAGDRYGLAVLAADIQDRTDNRTRFVIVARSAS